MQNDMCKNSGFRSRIQKSYKKFGIESKNLIIFSESIPNLYPLCLPLPHTDRTDLIGFVCGWEISRMLYGLWFFVGSHGSHRSHPFFVGGKSHGGSTVCGFFGNHTDSSRRLFVEICGRKNLYKKIFV